MNNPGLIKCYVAETTVGKYRIVKPGSTDDHVVQAAAASEALMGVSGFVGGDAGGRVDIIKSGITDVEYGGSVTRGDWLTSDANGKAVAAAPVVGANTNVIGRAEVSGISGDIGSVLIAPGRIQG